MHERFQPRRALEQRGAALCGQPPDLVSSCLTCRLWRHGRAHATDVLSTPWAGSAPRVGARNDGHESDERQAKHHCENFLDHATHLLSCAVFSAISVPVCKSPEKERVSSETWAATASSCGCFRPYRTIKVRRLTADFEEAAGARRVEIDSEADFNQWSSEGERTLRSRRVTPWGDDESPRVFWPFGTTSIQRRDIAGILVGDPRAKSTHRRRPEA